MATNKPEDQKRYEASFKARHPRRRIEYAAKQRSRYPERYRARNYVAVLVYQGKLKRQNCFVCDSPKTQAHHEDYSRPFDLIWYCKAHHVERHKQLSGDN